jgi:hypothetical protein
MSAKMDMKDTANASAKETGTHLNEASAKETGTHLNELAGLDATASGVASEPSLACYCRRALIRTATGDRLIEDLRVDDCVLLTSGGLPPNRGVGSRGRDYTRYLNPASAELCARTWSTNWSTSVVPK